MSTNSILKKEGIEIKSKFNTSQVNKIATIISQKICDSFPEHNLNNQDIFSILSRLDMYVAKMPQDSAIAKYSYKTNSIYFSNNMDLNNIDTLVIHECIHAIQEIRTPRNKLIRLGLYDLNKNKGQGINEAAVQLMAAKATNNTIENVKYYNMDFNTESPLYYPIETALMKQIIYFTGSYSLFHSTLYSNNVFKKTFIAKSSEKIYDMIENNFDLLIYYEEALSNCFNDINNDSINNQTSNKIRKINSKIDSIKANILDITISTQNIILESCFNSEFNLIKDQDSLTSFQKRLYDFSKLLINTDSYNFYNSFYCEMMNKLEEKRELIKQHGKLTYINDLQTELLDLERDTFSFKFFRKLFDKIKLLFEEAIREKN